MTNERAIKLLHRLQDEQFDGIHGDERREALEMAVRALEQNLVQESGGLVQDLVKDCISRQQAIEVIEAVFPVDPMKTEYAQGIACGAALAKTYIKQLPSAQPQWIPCSERLPRTEDFMIITMLDDSGDIPIIYSDFGWYASVGGFWVVDNETRKDVIAWMPLPEPYGGESDD